MSGLSDSWGITKQTFAEWSEDKVPRLAAALAYYTAFSLAPLLVLTVVILGAVGKKQDAKQQVVNQMQTLVGGKAASATSEIMQNASEQGSSKLATVISIIVLIFGASGVFGELQDSMNTIWEVKPKPNAGWWDFIKARFFSIAMVFGVAFLLIVSLVVSTVLGAITKKISGDIAFVGHALDIVVSLAVLSGLFMLIFKYLPDAKVPTQSVWPAGIVTAVLFTIGKYLLGIYIAKGSTASAFGAAGSLAALLIWVYYSAQILFFGAELSQVLAERQVGKVPAKPHAESVSEKDRQQQGIGHDRNRTGARRGAPMRAPAYAGTSNWQENSMNRQSVMYGLGGLALGAVAGAIAIHYGVGERPKSKLAEQADLEDRLRRIERAAGKVAYFTRYGQQVDLRERLGRVDDRLKALGREAKHEAKGWLNRAREMVGV
jgi:membrane protein